MLYHIGRAAHNLASLRLLSTFLDVVLRVTENDRDYCSQYPDTQVMIISQPFIEQQRRNRELQEPGAPGTPGSGPKSRNQFTGPIYKANVVTRLMYR